MDSCELVLLISTLSCAIAKDKSEDELAFLAIFFSQLGGTLGAMIANDVLINKEAE